MADTCHITGGLPVARLHKIHDCRIQVAGRLSRELEEDLYKEDRRPMPPEPQVE